MQQHPEPPSLDLLGLLQDATVQRHIKGPRVRQQQMAMVAARIKDDKKKKATDFKAKAGPKARGRPSKQQK